MDLIEEVLNQQISDHKVFIIKIKCKHITNKENILRTYKKKEDISEHNQELMNEIE